MEGRPSLEGGSARDASRGRRLQSGLMIHTHFFLQGLKGKMGHVFNFARFDDG